MLGSIFKAQFRRRTFNGTVFEFVVADGDILNFWRFKAMSIGFWEYNGSCRTCTGHVSSLS